MLNTIPTRERMFATLSADDPGECWGGHLTNTVSSLPQFQNSKKMPHFVGMLRERWWRQQFRQTTKIHQENVT